MCNAREPLYKLGQGSSERCYYDAGNDGFTNAVLNALGYIGRLGLAACVSARLFWRKAVRK